MVGWSPFPKAVTGFKVEMEGWSVFPKALTDFKVEMAAWLPFLQANMVYKMLRVASGSSAKKALQTTCFPPLRSSKPRHAVSATFGSKIRLN